MFDPGELTEPHSILVLVKLLHLYLISKPVFPYPLVPHR